MSSELKTVEKRKELRKKIFSIEDTIRNNTDPNYKTDASYIFNVWKDCNNNRRRRKDNGGAMFNSG